MIMETVGSHLYKKYSKANQKQSFETKKPVQNNMNKVTSILNLGANCKEVLKKLRHPSTIETVVVKDLAKEYDSQ